METAKQSLKPGRYMKSDSVIRFISTYFSSQSSKLVDLPKHQGEFGTYFETSDLKSVFTETVFREMECDVTTHLILSENDLKEWNSTSNIKKSK